MKRFYLITGIVVKLLHSGFAIVNSVGAYDKIITLSLLFGAGFILLSFIPNWKHRMPVTMPGIIMITSGYMAMAIGADVILWSYISLFVVTHILIMSLMFKTEELSKT